MATTERDPIIKDEHLAYDIGVKAGQEKKEKHGTNS
jgi:hypothetical protein